jgi:hypothetical protein
MTTTPRPQTMALAVVSIVFDGDTINLPALFELRAAGWSVEIEHSGAFPDWDMEPQVFFNARKLLPDNSPGIRADDKLKNDVWEEIRAYEKKWDGFFDHIDFFKNPKAKAWRYHPWNDYSRSEDFA